MLAGLTAGVSVGIDAASRHPGPSKKRPRASSRARRRRADAGLSFICEDEPGRRTAASLLTRDRPDASPPTSPSCRSCCG